MSGGGRTLENIHQAIHQGRLNASINQTICSNPDAYGIQRAKKLGLPCLTISRRQYQNAQAFSEAIWPRIRESEIDMVCLAGFLCLLAIPQDMTNRVINIHPGLLPAFGGYGMFGRHVHEAVLAAGCKISGCTVHMADQSYDTGPIIVQRSCPVLENDSPETLGERVFEQECLAYPQALRLFQQGKVRFEGRVARVSE
jgi:formyltetrahydrofolate-dependent phosphoribosylglycinamide formyltransferase